MTTPDPLKPGSVIGILGGGQLGRMLAEAASSLGFRCHVFCPEADSPAFDVASARTLADYEDEAALHRFAAQVDVVTTEFENVPALTAEVLARLKPVRPGPKALAVAQDRLVEKSFIHNLGIAVADFTSVDRIGELAAQSAAIGYPQIIKTRRLGYDGKGQVRIARAADADAAYEAIGRAPAIIEGHVTFSREVSVVIARGVDGETRAFDIAENEHRDGILSVSHVPARIAHATAREAVAAAARIADALGYVGVLAVEFFVVGEGDAEALIVNEIAPRVHNSGHWTQDGALTSQFEQHIRAITGWPLGATTRLAPEAEMINLIGDDVREWREIASDPVAKLHLYGKREARDGRKMGHVNRLIGLTRG